MEEKTIQFIEALEASERYEEVNLGDIVQGAGRAIKNIFSTSATAAKRNQQAAQTKVQTAQTNLQNAQSKVQAKNDKIASKNTMRDADAAKKIIDLINNGAGIKGAVNKIKNTPKNIGNAIKDTFGSKKENQSVYEFLDIMNEVKELNEGVNDFINKYKQQHPNATEDEIRQAANQAGFSNEKINKNQNQNNYKAAADLKKENPQDSKYLDQEVEKLNNTAAKQQTQNNQQENPTEEQKTEQTQENPTDNTQKNSTQQDDKSEEQKTDNSASSDKKTEILNNLQNIANEAENFTIESATNLQKEINMLDIDNNVKKQINQILNQQKVAHQNDTKQDNSADTGEKSVKDNGEQLDQTQKAEVQKVDQGIDNSQLANAIEELKSIKGKDGKVPQKIQTVIDAFNNFNKSVDDAQQ